MQTSLFTSDQTHVAHSARDLENGEAYLTNVNEDAVINNALAILMKRYRKPQSAIATPSDLRHYARLKIGGRPHEIFGIFYINSQNEVIDFEELFRGSLTQTSVYPREVVISALHKNAASVIFAHNHPSGSTTPSTADEGLTSVLKSALAMVDIRVLDHVIVSALGEYSMAEHGLI